ncbi:ubiquinol oxidase subunit II [Lichenifustis flavocetrariae]|uniref:Ubiquinol oxidase subunit 2 n=1 Tax=Lichenifustis flavocetrariae TaxID=2949735 RepID=A0AA42CGE1_9HYPH|nr:ubiquinol oxidase subunit II [Lichenifustis flavocetrariae]MCW6506498.1 ubiquinol oxidase subunit II [Lichenifustis flavocetrariae]
MSLPKLLVRGALAWSTRITAGLLGFLLAGCQARVLDPQGPVGVAERMILLNALAIMLCIVVPLIVAVLGFAWWFRTGNPKARRLPEWSFSGQIEIVTWSVPLMAIMFLGGIAWFGSHELDPGKPLSSEKKPLDVQVVSLDWKWLFILPDQKVASINSLVVPVGTPVRFALTSASVMNAFFIPRLGSMIYTMNGMVQKLNLQADHEGTYDGLSSHFSGDGFPGMHFTVRAVPQAEFDAWVEAARGSGPALDENAYTSLARQSMNVPAATFRDVAADLFDRIATQQIPPGPGPDQTDPQSKISPKAGG